MESWTLLVVLLAASGALATPFINKLAPGQEYPAKNSVRQPSNTEDALTYQAQPSVSEITSTIAEPVGSIVDKVDETPVKPEVEPVAADPAIKPDDVNSIVQKPENSVLEITSTIAEPVGSIVDKVHETPVKPEVEPVAAEPAIKPDAVNPIEEKPENSDLPNEASIKLDSPNESEPTKTESQEAAVAPADPVIEEQPAVLIPKIGDVTKNEVRVDYTGAQVWKISTNRTGVRGIITRLRRRNLLSTWGGDHSSADVVVRQDAIDEVTRIFKRENISYVVIIEDLQKRIDEENPPLSPEEMELHDRRGHRMTWKQYHRLEDIHGFMEYLAKTYPTLISTKSIGKSHEGRDLKVLRISDGKPTNKAVFIDGGIHAREWISPATVTYFINQFAENFDEESDDIKNTDWYFLPVVNPDGYEYTHTTDRLWRKNRKQSIGARVCSGTDLNRNFGYRWGGKGASSNPCSETFRGRTAFSEPESKALSDFIKASGANFSAYLTYHSYGQYLLYPWGYDNVVPPDYKDLEEVGKTIAKAIEETGGSKYSVGSSSGLLYPASGGSDDWAKAQGIKYSYTVELSDTGRYGFILPTSYIDSVAKESLAGLRALMKIIHHG
ncbi:carboxypeptidase A1-like [Leguminivora glycinivorella]|uniref:carboxypeptidase A1-like n=1 Tax=Leguminivora glycinivorella TaxID=1035111 RepID=UPI0020106748|nr:carboxypeptidase A1-like [Leguminivora glycinivorella]